MRSPVTDCNLSLCCSGYPANEYGEWLEVGLNHTRGCQDVAVGDDASSGCGCCGEWIQAVHDASHVRCIGPHLSINDSVWRLREKINTSSFFVTFLTAAKAVKNKITESFIVRFVRTPKPKCEDPKEMAFYKLTAFTNSWVNPINLNVLSAPIGDNW